MQKEPFIITLGNEDLPNISTGNGRDYGFEFRQTNVWKDENDDVVKLLDTISEKLDKIIGLILKSGKE